MSGMNSHEVIYVRLQGCSVFPLNKSPRPLFKKRLTGVSPRIRMTAALKTSLYESTDLAVSVKMKLCFRPVNVFEYRDESTTKFGIRECSHKRFLSFVPRSRAAHNDQHPNDG